MSEAPLRITSKGQITIPSDIREQLGLTPNSEVILEVEGNAVRIRPAVPQVKPLQSLIVAAATGASCVPWKRSSKASGSSS
ncbi:MAG TPA: AbrB/MazE/SpoVT family DNA-binding domain-containing protein [Thermoanaerobaculia bacterium]